MEIDLGYGKGFQKVLVPDKNLMCILTAKDAGRELSDDEIVKAIENSIGSPKLGEIIRAGEKVVIITSDITRPMPTAQIMPLLLDELYKNGISKNDITLVFALGTHRGHTDEEKRNLAGERAWNEISCIDSNPDDTVCMGVTSYGTPVDITRIVAEADRRICLGNIEYHYFAGYSGGAKAIMPGVAAKNAIKNNHGMMTSEEACAGNLETNPVRRDIEEAGEKCGIDFIINVVLNEKKKIIGVFAGNYISAHREGCRFLDRTYMQTLNGKADIVLASQGGYPKDLNLYQMQKALDNARQAVSPGGIIILVGSCCEGFGGKVFEEWMLSHDSPQDIIEHIKRDFVLGGHKAAAYAMAMQAADIYLVSDLPDELILSMHMFPKSSAQEALNDAFSKVGSDANVLAMPYAGSTLPKVIRNV